MIERITHGDELIAIILRKDYCNPGITFLTPQEFSQQLAYMKHPSGHKISPHVHNIVNRNVKHTQEVLWIKRGKVLVDLYTPKKEHFKSVTISTGDVIFLASGGHSFTMLEETEIIEVKQGPYAGEGDKERF